MLDCGGLVFAFVGGGGSRSWFCFCFVAQSVRTAGDDFYYQTNRDMTQEEAVKVLLIHIKFLFDEVCFYETNKSVGHTQFETETYEDNKKQLEAYSRILGTLDPELATLEGLKQRSIDYFDSMYYSELPEPGEAEQELYRLLSPWYMENQDDFYISDEGDIDGDAVLAKINMEKSRSGAVTGGCCINAPSEYDNFGFRPRRGRIRVVYNYESESDFCSYPIEFQEKALELVKETLENHGG